MGWGRRTSLTAELQRWQVPARLSQHPEPTAQAKPLSGAEDGESQAPFTHLQAFGYGWAVQACADFCSTKPCCDQQAKGSEKTDKEHDNCPYLQRITVSYRGRAQDSESMEASLNDARLRIERYKVNILRTGGVGQSTARVLSPFCRPASLGELEEEDLPCRAQGEVLHGT